MLFVHVICSTLIR